MRLRIRIKHKKQQRQPSKNPQSRLDLTCPPGNQLAERIKHEPGCNSDPDIVRKAHQCDHCESRNQLGEIVKANSGERRKNEQAYDDQRWSVSLRLEWSYKWRAEPRSPQTACR